MTQEEATESSKMPAWFILLFVPLLAIMVVLILIPFTQKTPLQDIVLDETDPLDIYTNTNSQFILSQKTYPTFDQYFTSFKDGEDSSLIDSDYTISAPRLEYNFSFYNLKREYYDHCTTKEAQINFTNPKTSDFSFNYQNKTFKYEINVYPEMYFFADQLKAKDCYFEEDKYTQGYLEDPYNNNFVDALADDFIALKDQGYSDDEIVEIATLFVQSIPYGTDKTQLNRYPYETIYEGQGNCLDKSVILVGILEKLGYTTYFILGQAKQYHALVGIECEKPNLHYEGKKLCFAETTVFTPISSNVTIDIEQIVPVSTGDKIYKGVSYGPSLVQKFKEKHQRREQIEAELDEIDKELDRIQVQMCDTDCAYCSGNVVDFERSQAELWNTCDDATEMNELIKEYNDNVKKHSGDGNRSGLIQEWYEIYYDLEKSMFNNVRLLRKT